MAAVTDIRRYTGVAGSSDIDSIINTGTTLAVNDEHTASGEYVDPVPVPGGGTNYSYWCSLRMAATTPPVGHLNNLRTWFQDRDRTGDPGGITWLGQSANVGTNSGYRQATGDVGVSGDVLSQANHTGLTAPPVDPRTWTPANPKLLAGTLNAPSTGNFGDFVVVQRGITSAYPRTGPTPDEVIEVAYDET